jgi:hypothetical protein
VVDPAVCWLNDKEDSMEESEGTRPEQEEEDVEAHRRKVLASEGAPSAEGEEEDDVELHRRLTR